MVEDSVFVWFFCCWKGWKFACKPNCMAGDYKTFSFQIWFSPLWIFLSCSKARFILTSPDWGGAHNHSGKRPVAWKGSWLEAEQFFRSSEGTFNSHPISLHTSVAGTWWQHGLVTGCLMKVIISHDAAPPQRTVANLASKRSPLYLILCLGIKIQARAYGTFGATELLL